MIKIEQVTLQTVTEDNYFFTIPLYQRLYVWGEEQIGLLLEDLWSAFESDQGIFYLGTTLVVKRPAEHENAPSRYELIDGQQRFTTLWLLSLNLSESALSMYGYAQWNGQDMPRISFAIRPEIKAWFAWRITNKTLQAGQPSELEVPENAEQLDAALSQINSWLQQKPAEQQAAFACFIYNKVQLVITEAAPETDLNRLFEIINNRGVQLQHHEILKARILDRLPQAGREGYNHLWEACAAINGYVERNLVSSSPLSNHQLYEMCNKSRKAGPVAMPSAGDVLEKITQQHSTQLAKGISLADIIETDPITETVDKQQGDKAIDKHQPVRSLISFPVLLLHTLRLHLWRTGRSDLPRIEEKSLLALFTDHWLIHTPDEQEVQNFVELLWEIRWLFDQYIIKWVETETDKGEIHRLRTLRLSNNEKALSRDTESLEDDRGFILLQAMLYHSQGRTTQYWLTPLLGYLHTQQTEGSDASRLLYLQHLDNQLFCTTDNRTLVAHSRALLENFWQHSPYDDLAILEEHKGTGFPHYWFYKLDYVLWCRMHEEKGESWKNFRMTARSSVEHISPQNLNERDSQQNNTHWLDCFGNLGLVSRELNSSFGNKPYKEKQAQFLGQRTLGVPSLKLDLIYTHEHWGEYACEVHQTQMLEQLQAYLTDISAQVSTLT